MGNARADPQIKKHLEKLVATRGLPTDIDAAYDFASELHPVLTAARNAYYRRALKQITAAARRAGGHIEPAQQRPYPLRATWVLVLRALGVRKPQAWLDSHARKTISDAAARVQLPSQLLTPGVDPAEAKHKFVRAATGAALRHARAAERQAVVDTARRAKVVVKSKYRANDPAARAVDGQKFDDSAAGQGVELGWARVLTGHSSCTFCALLASRPPVYSRETVLTTTDGERYHDWCDCEAVLVVSGQNYRGKKQADRLRALYESSDEFMTEEELHAEARIAESRDALGLPPEARSARRRRVFEQRWAAMTDAERAEFLHG